MVLTDEDLKAIKTLMKITIDEELEIKLEQKLTEKLGRYPNKEDFYAETVKILKKLENLEAEKDILSSSSSDHSDRIEVLEKIHPHGKHQILQS